MSTHRRSLVAAAALGALLAAPLLGPAPVRADARGVPAVLPGGLCLYTPVVNPDGSIATGTAPPMQAATTGSPVVTLQSNLGPITLALDPGATYPRWVLAMANSGPNTNGSQFFLVFRDSQFRPDYTPFGTVTAGLEVLDTAAEGGTFGPANDRPRTEVVLERVVVAN